MVVPLVGWTVVELLGTVVMEVDELLPGPVVVVFEVVTWVLLEVRVLDGVLE